jgi:hypothetical protein
MNHDHTYLFVPGNRPERIVKAIQAGADAVIVDLEDAVAPDDKVAARQALHDSWARHASIARDEGVTLLLRINAAESARGRFASMPGMQYCSHRRTEGSAGRAACQSIGSGARRLALSTY